MNKNIPAPRAFTNAMNEYFERIDIVNLLLDGCVPITGNEHDKVKTNELFEVFRKVL